MKPKTKKIVGWSTTTLLAIVLGFGTYVGVKNWDAIKAGFNGQVLYTQEQYDDNYDKGVADGIGLKEGYEKLIADLTKSLSATKLDLTDKNQQLERLKLNIGTLNDSIERLEEEKLTLQQNAETNAVQINQLTIRISELISERDLLVSEQQTLALEKQALAAQVTQLTNDVTYYQLLLEAYAESSKLIVTFKLDDGTVYGVQTLDPNTKPIITDPTSNDGAIFLYWTLDGVRVNPNETTITENTTFIAVFARTYNVKFIIDGVETSVVVPKGEYATSKFELPQNTDYLKINYYTVNGAKVNPATFPITADTTFIANVTHYFDTNFIVDGSNYAHQFVEQGKVPTEVSAPHKSNYKFIGWSLDGVNAVTVSETIINQTTNFIALFIPVWDGETVDVSWFTGNQNEYSISTIEQLAGVATLCSYNNPNNNLAGVTLNITQNLYINALGTNNIWKSIPYFAGSINGLGHTIYGLHQGSDLRSQGFIFHAFEKSNVSIKNLKFEDLSIETNSSRAGGLITYLEDGANVVIENVHIDGTIISNDSNVSAGINNMAVGGLIGDAYRNNNITIENSSFTGELESYMVSGLIGRVQNGKTITVESCTVDAKLSIMANSVRQSPSGAGIAIVTNSPTVNVSNCNIKTLNHTYDPTGTATFNEYVKAPDTAIVNLLNNTYEAKK